MAPRFWKWRTRGAAPHFASRIGDARTYDLIFATDLLNLAELQGLRAGELPPALLYFHENQLLYPLAPGEVRDIQFVLTDVISALSARRVLFNSHSHREAFFRELPGFLSRLPDYRLTDRVAELQAKSSVLYPGIDAGLAPPQSRTAPRAASQAAGEAGEEAGERNAGPLLLWNHRWEHDKNPEGFFRPLYRLAEEGIPFRLAVLGERYSRAPEIFAEARRRLADRIIRYGYAEERQEYIRLLQEADIVVSTARQENFGIAVVEAIRCGCRPLLPARLSYPELIPEAYHRQVLYEGEEELTRRLRELCTAPETIPLPGLSEAAARFEWPQLIEEYDTFCEEAAGLLHAAGVGDE
jgi:glycosyltransferase involved in cell wall biosynthesis